MDTGIQEIIELYVSEKKSLRDIATIVGKDRVTIKNILLRNNVSIRSRTDSIKNKVSLGEEIENKIINMYTNGYLPNEIKKEFNVGNTTIYRILKKNKIKPKGKLGLVNRASVKERKFVESNKKLEDNLVKDYKKGLTTYDLEEKYRVSRTYISKIMTKRGVVPREQNVLSKKEEKNAIKLYTTTNTPATTIAKQFNITPTTLYNILQRHEIDLRKNNVSPLEGKDKEIIELYQLGESAKKIAKKLGSSSSVIEKILHRYNVEMRDVSHSKQIYSINEHYFDNIDTEDKAYFLGFLYADGTQNSSKATVRLSLAIIDIEILQKFKEVLQYEKPLYISKERKRNNYVCKQIGTLSITNKHISQQLYKLGVIDRKTLVLTFPDWLDKKLYNHFIRGYFDGDGSISGLFTIAGTKNFTKRIQEILMENCDLRKTKIISVGNIHILSYGGAKQLMRIKEFIYKDATIFLKRKKQKFDEIKILEKEIPIESLIKSFDEGKSYRNIAAEFNIAENTVSRKLKEKGLSRSKKSLNEDKIIQLYTKDLKTCIELGKQFNVCHTTILNVLKRNNVKPRNSHTARKTLYLLEPNKEKIIDLYTNQNKSAQYIASMYGCNHNTIIKFLVKNNVKIRNKEEAKKSIINQNKENVINLYTNKKLSTEEIARKYNVTGAVVRKFLKRWEIPSNKIRQYSEEIKKMYSEGISSQKIADNFKVSKTTILNIINDKY